MSHHHSRRLFSSCFTSWPAPCRRMPLWRAPQRVFGGARGIFLLCVLSWCVLHARHQQVGFPMTLEDRSGAQQHALQLPHMPFDGTNLPLSQQHLPALFADECYCLQTWLAVVAQAIRSGSMQHAARWHIVLHDCSGRGWRGSQPTCTSFGCAVAHVGAFRLHLGGMLPSGANQWQYHTPLVQTAFACTGSCKQM